AGPVSHRTAQVTNLPWSINADSLQQQFNIAHVELINDFAAIGYGIDCLQQQDFVDLQAGHALDKATRVVIGAGTGLGEGYLVWQDGGYVPLPSEGGHADFAPASEVQMNLLGYLQARFGHVSYERVVSGMGLVNIYDFLACNQPASIKLQQALLDGDDPAAIIAEFAMEKNEAVAVQALDIFIECYGAQAGNLALTCLARGGVYIAGGIAPKIMQRMQQGDFMRAFCNKGRFASLMQALPVKVIMNPEVGLHGAIRVALRS
ncbi:MAG: glucokinase, partial [Pseudomonadota bacterium]|nr:glucokinase [Pseudomonadota bacterium]